MPSGHPVSLAYPSLTSYEPGLRQVHPSLGAVWGEVLVYISAITSDHYLV